MIKKVEIQRMQGASSIKCGKGRWIYRQWHEHIEEIGLRKWRKSRCLVLSESDDEFICDSSGPFAEFICKGAWLCMTPLFLLIQTWMTEFWFEPQQPPTESPLVILLMPLFSSGGKHSAFVYTPSNK